MLPENWEDIDVETMPLPGSSTETDEEQPKIDPILKIKKKRPRRVPKKEPEKSTKKKKRRRPRRKRPCSSLRDILRQQDCTVERTPVYTNHALQRLHQGRCGEFVTKKNGNAVVVVTILPANGYCRSNMESIRTNRKQRSIKYKVR